MARPGNTSAVKHGAFLNAAKHAARLVRDRFRRRGEREARQILVAAGLEKNPTARMVCRQIGRLESMAHRLQAWHERRGYFTAGGVLKTSVAQEVSVIERLLGEARRLLELLIERQKPPDLAGTIFTCELASGEPAFAVYPAASWSPQGAVPLAAGAPQEERSVGVEGEEHGPGGFASCGAAAHARAAEARAAAPADARGAMRLDHGRRPRRSRCLVSASWWSCTT